MAIEDSNQNIDYIIEDYGSDTTKAVNSAKKLIEINNVDVIIGPEWVEFSEAIIPIANENKIVFISPWEDYELESTKSTYYFSMSPTEKIKTKKTIEYMQSQQITKVAIIYSNNSFSIADITLFKEEIKNTNIQVILDIKTEQDAIDYKTEILKLKTKDLDAIYTVISTDNSQGQLNKQLKELDVNLPLFITFARAESNIFLNNYKEYTTKSIYSAPKEYSLSREFNEKYKSRFGEYPTAISAARAYDATMIILDAIKNGANNSEDIKTYLNNLNDYNGYSNKIKFNENGHVILGDAIIKEI